MMLAILVMYLIQFQFTFHKFEAKGRRFFFFFDELEVMGSKLDCASFSKNIFHLLGLIPIRWVLSLHFFAYTQEGGC